MGTITQVHRITPQNFANWIIRKTAGLPYQTMQSEEGHFNLQTARVSNDFRQVTIDGIYVTPSSSDPRAEIAYPLGVCISFEMIPLDAERTELVTDCNGSDPILRYCNQLLSEIERRWPAEEDAAAEANGLSIPIQAESRWRRLLGFRTAYLIAGFAIGILVSLVSLFLFPTWAQTNFFLIILFPIAFAAATSFVANFRKAYE